MRDFFEKVIVVGVVLCWFVINSVALVVTGPFKGAIDEDKPVSILRPCKPLVVLPSARMAVLRLDDIQAYAWPDISERIIGDAIGQGAPVVLGVIPFNLQEDKSIYSFLKRHHCNVEFAIHGWDHQESMPGRGEFAFLSYNEAFERLSKGKQVIEALEGDVVHTFIPPNNEYSSSTAKALADLGISRVSAFGTGFYDFDTATYNFYTDQIHTAKQVASDCEKKYAEGDHLCVIMVHPQDFLTQDSFDETKYAEYRRMLHILKEQDVTFVRFEDIEPIGG